MKAGYNEPDDIRQYDNDPRSPYYIAPHIGCDNCDKSFDPECGVDHTFVGDFCSEECFREYYLCSNCEEVDCICD